MRTPDEYRRELKPIADIVYESCDTYDGNTIISKIKDLYLESLRFECMCELERRYPRDDTDGTFFDEMVETMIGKHYPREWR